MPKKRGNYSNYLLFKRNFSAAKLLQSLRFWMIRFIILTTRLFERSSRLQQRSRPMTRPPLPGASRRTSDNAVSERGPNRAPSAFQEGKMAKPNLTNQKTLSASAIIVYGIDATGKPKAGRFPERQAAAAKKAARSLKLAVCNVDRPALVEIVAKIPVGRVHDQGSRFCPTSNAACT
ncbi:bll8202 [Bradyrhizobium diazoefficiens USDA 110]|uniref:Bll8202 protein n=1 Tax=Bradyrhizobium diazoefficiens (strain JCM 10833 / BCRC 13528 / IAM 13628 / NBRC 14792 / USDA 110) TaxID=224911 RepID=Q89BF3_BRADU|nr:bll8202 [Bradyrhizobium diazoefficiens USDA 110]